MSKWQKEETLGNVTVPESYNNKSQQTSIRFRILDMISSFWMTVSVGWKPEWPHIKERQQTQQVLSSFQGSWCEAKGRYGSDRGEGSKQREKEFSRCEKTDVLWHKEWTLESRKIQKFRRRWDKWSHILRRQPEIGFWGPVLG